MQILYIIVWWAANSIMSKWFILGFYTTINYVRYKSSKLLASRINFITTAMENEQQEPILLDF